MDDKQPQAGLPDPATKPFLTIGELAALMGVGRAALYKQLDKGTFPLAHALVDYGKQQRVRTVEVLRYLHPEQVAKVEAVEVEQVEALA